MPYCPKCGAEISSDAAFCPKCGNQILVSAIPSASTTSPAERRQYGEKREKQEKREKGEKTEKGGGSGDRSGPIVGGLILIWLGIVFYVIQVGYVTGSYWWSYFLIGIGVILLVQAVIRYATHNRRSATGTMIAGFILLIIGLAGASGISNWWFLILIAIGIWVIASGVTAARRNPKP
ncbi:MAG: zinc-ribbon domain-containing protein [Nitrososphaeria archaeon]